MSPANVKENSLFSNDSLSMREEEIKIQNKNKTSNHNAATDGTNCAEIKTGNKR